MSRILIVEDNELNLDMLSRRLALRGFEVLTAVTGERGLEIAEKEKPDIILLDLRLPGIDGWEVLQRLKSNSDLEPIPVIALTAHVFTNDRERAFKAGFDEFAVKPVELPLLMQKMETLLARRSVV